MQWMCARSTWLLFTFFEFPDLCLTKSIAETQLDGEGEQQPGCTKDPAALGGTHGAPPGKMFKDSNEAASFPSCWESYLELGLILLYHLSLSMEVSAINFLGRGIKL